MFRKTIFKPIPLTLLYVVIGLIWIYLTDSIVVFISNNIKALAFFQLIKGTLYILLTGLGLFIVIYCYNRHIIKINLMLEKKSRILNLLSNCNQILIRNIEEENFLYEICKMIVEMGGYKMAWIGFKQNDETKSVKPVAFYGSDEEYIKNIKISWDNNEYGKGPTGTAIRESRTIVFSDLENSPNYKIWLNAAIKRGYKSSCALPIIVEKEVIGALNIYSIDINAFDKEELELLEEMAKDIGYGIKERRKYKENLQLIKKIEEDNIKLKELDILKSNFLSIISHELRTPITPIKGFIEVLLKTGDNLLEQQKEYLEILKSNTIRLQKLIEDLIDISRIERGVIDINKEKVNLGDVIETAINDIKFLADKEQIKIKYDKKEIEINIDKYRISQVLINLLQNSIKFSKSNSVIELKYYVEPGKNINLPGYVSYILEKEKNYVLFEIIDSGVGIKQDDLLKIFDLFYQIESPLVRKKGGLGIGLNIAKRIIELHGGIIWAESEGVDRGTTFKFILPF